MPGGRSRVKPTPANYPPSASDEVSHLELHLQQQLQEDIASDVYTECNINHQENEIIAYLNKIFGKNKPRHSSSWNSKEEVDDQDVFLTPKCVSPYADKTLKSLTSSPSTELNKEYYALVPIDSSGNILDKELKEQDLLFNAFNSIIKSQAPDLYKSQKSVKPTTLYLNIDTNKLVKNSTSCESLNDNCLSNITKEENKKRSQVIIKKYTDDTELSYTEYCNKVIRNTESISDKAPDSTYSPDSLIADDPSSSSDYLSAAYACSPVANSSACTFHLNVGDSITKMENIFTSSDSGLENTGLLESINSHKDITLTDLSLNESTLHDLTTDDASNSHDSMSVSSSMEKRKFVSGGDQSAMNSSESNPNCENIDSTQKYKDSKSSKEEKQRQNEEIVIMESSSLSSETGSWESVFPPKAAEKDICKKLINHEQEFTKQDSSIEASNLRQFDDTSGQSKPNDFNESFGTSLVHKSPFKKTSCFIDATLLIDEEDHTINMKLNKDFAAETVNAPSQPVPICSNKLDLSPNDWSESNDNEDSLEQTDNKETNHKDLSPTIFDMTPVTEDSLISDAFEKVAQVDSFENKKEPQTSAEKDICPLPNTPHNSLRVLTPKCNDSTENCEGPLSDTLKNECINAKVIKQTHDSSPIVSGGASIKDHLPQISTYSPITRRKLENVPIVSGAYIPNLDRCQSQSPKPSSSAAWVIDVSKHTKNDHKTQKDESGIKLNDYSNNLNGDNCNRSRSSVDSDGSEKSSQKFYIDFSDMPTSTSAAKQNVETSAEKKYIFSMFIDLGDKTGVKEMPARLGSSAKKSNVIESKNVFKNESCSKTNGLPNLETHNSFVPQIDNSDERDFEKYECLCEDPKISITEIISAPKNILANLPKNNTVEKSDLSDTCFKVTENKSKGENTIEQNIEQQTSSIANMSIDAEPSADCSTDHGHPSTRDSNFDEQNDWNEAGASGLSYDAPGRYSAASTIREESITDVESTNEMESGDFFHGEMPPVVPEPFVKLSDLDKPLNKPYKGKGKAIDRRMTRSIPENNWCGQNQNAAPISMDVISSFHSENALSLNRLFPHLQNEISRSMPGSLSSRTRSPMRPGPADGEDQASDGSELSSMQSSACRSAVGNSTPEDTGLTSSIINQCQSRLGQDLLRMFLEEIAPDVIVEVSGRRIKAHKCILSSRCQYFAGILSGGWVESAGNVIPLPPFAYNVVHFAMCHIYSGTSAIPESVSIVELATLADMLGLEGLKEAIMFSLKSKYCHHFHRPCHVCIAGVLECFPLSSLCGLDDLYHKCLRWITKYFPKVWPTRAFATLPADLHDRCFQQHVVNMTVENVADTVFGCGLAMMMLQANVRGTDNVEVMCRRLINASAQFAASRLEAVLRSMEPLPLDAPPPALRALDEFVEAALNRAPIEEVCRGYAYLESVVREIQMQQLAKPDLISNGYQNTALTGDESFVHARANVWKLKCQYLLVDDALRVVNTQAFRDLPLALQQKLRKLGCVASPMQPRRCPNLRHSRPPPSLNSHNAEIERMRACFVPYSQRPSTSFNVQDSLRGHVELRDRNKSNKVPKVKTTKAQEERAKFNMAKNAQPQCSTSSRSTKMFENAKPRYLEPKAVKQPEKKMAAQGKLMPKMMSSSESSRNSSPIHTHGMRGSRTKSRQLDRKGHAMSQDSLATNSRPRTAEPSTDSLSESQNSNKYATFTKAKHTKASNDSAAQLSSSVSSRSQHSVYSKSRTKIPVSLTMSKTKQPVHTGSNSISDISKRNISGGGGPSALTQPSRSKGERKVPGSLMMATKSSSAKMVQKTAAKEKPTKTTSKQSKPSSSRQNNETSDIPVMGRSGTFLKDEPTFEHNNFDIDN
ncbi:uncharacterized protein LOC106133894 isoform X2 [Amyelois transitella]|uniref:uncharacterized protein LOC106133894 isoform X2 n=1 Tax=Amyelois transitella TaxID=680683 RepID=UPI0029905709|nr:uncharacterized protein LOC106133894 isoform X2 [Amyelois transitella]